MKATPTQLFERWYASHFPGKPLNHWQSEDKLDMERAFLAGRRNGLRDYIPMVVEQSIKQFRRQQSKS